MNANGTPHGSTDRSARPVRPGGNTRCRKTEGNDMLRRLGIRAKVMAVLAVPMIVHARAGAFISCERPPGAAVRQGSRQRRSTTLQAYAPAVEPRCRPSGSLSLNGGYPRADRRSARKPTDAALAAVRPLTAALDLDQFPQPVVDQFVEVQLAHNTMLPAVRTRVDIKSQRAQLERNYAAIIAGPAQPHGAGRQQPREPRPRAVRHRLPRDRHHRRQPGRRDDRRCPAAEHPCAGPRVGPCLRHADRVHRAGPCPCPRRHGLRSVSTPW